MTAQQPHCEHECVCPDWKASHSDEDEDPEPCNISCMQRMTRPNPPAPSRLNTQPQGCTCEDCIRFRDAECPYPDSNITMNRCNSFLLNIEEHNAAIARAATLAALDAFGKCIDAEMISAGDCQYSDEPVVTVAALAKIEESLRTAAQEDEQP
jgi:hypothetical protein